MGWKQHLLRRLARSGDTSPPFEARRLLEVVQRIEGDPALAADLDARDEDGVWRVVLALYDEPGGSR